jgi:hypothetical protein
MSRNELVQIAKLVQIIVEREVQRSTKPLISEIKRLNSKISLLNESDAKTKPAFKTKDSIQDIFSEIKTTEKPKTGGYLQGIFEDITPFDEEGDDTESILDYKIPQGTDPVSKVLNKLQTTDFKKTLQIMEQSANRHNGSQMYR